MLHWVDRQDRDAQVDRLLGNDLGHPRLAAVGGDDGDVSGQRLGQADGRIADRTDRERDLIGRAWRGRGRPWRYFERATQFARSRPSRSVRASRRRERTVMALGMATPPRENGNGRGLDSRAAPSAARPTTHDRKASAPPSVTLPRSPTYENSHFRRVRSEAGIFLPHGLKLATVDMRKAGNTNDLHPPVVVDAGCPGKRSQPLGGPWVKRSVETLTHETSGRRIRTSWLASDQWPGGTSNSREE